MTTNAYLTANSYLGFVAEATRGTLPTMGTVFWVPVSAPQVSPMQTFLDDAAFRGSPVGLYDAVQGVRHDEFDHKSYVYADTFPVYMAALLGGTDTVTPTTASYSHSIPLLNDASTGSQPLSYSICNFDGANYFTVKAAQAGSLTLAAGVETAAEATLKWFGNPYADTTSAPTVFDSLSFTSEHPIPSWDATISVNSSDLNYVNNVELTIDRKTAPIFTAGTQAPYRNFAGPLEVSGKFTAVVASQADIWSISTTTGLALAFDQVPIVITLTDPNDINSTIHDSVSFQMSQCQFMNVKRTQGKIYTEVEVEFKAEANTTDAASGYSPLTFTGVNGVSGAYS